MEAEVWRDVRRQLDRFEQKSSDQENSQIKKPEKNMCRSMMVQKVVDVSLVKVRRTKLADGRIYWCR